MVSRWTDEEKKYLRDNYHDGKKEDLLLNLSKHSWSGIKWKAEKLGLKRGWTEKEKQFLGRNYRDMSKDDLMLNLKNHSWNGIKWKAYQLGLYKINLWTEEEIQFMIKNYYGISKENLMLNLNRHSWNGIKFEAHSLRLKRNKFLVGGEISKTRKKLGLSKGENNHNFGKHLPDKVREKISESMKGEKNPNYIDGNSSKYCSLFNEKFKEEIREKFDRVCFVCGYMEDENGQKLSVHHVNYDKDSLCGDQNCYFLPLCIACHSKTNYNRDQWERFFTICCQYPEVMGY